jgi:hypothetical protein
VTDFCQIRLQGSIEKWLIFEYFLKIFSWGIAGRVGLTFYL